MTFKTEFKGNKSDKPAFAKRAGLVTSLTLATSMALGMNVNAEEKKPEIKETNTELVPPGVGTGGSDTYALTDNAQGPQLVHSQRATVTGFWAFNGTYNFRTPERTSLNLTEGLHLSLAQVSLTYMGGTHAYNASVIDGAAQSALGVSNDGGRGSFNGGVVGARFDITRVTLQVNRETLVDGGTKVTSTPRVNAFSLQVALGGLRFLRFTDQILLNPQGLNTVNYREESRVFGMIDIGPAFDAKHRFDGLNLRLVGSDVYTQIRPYAMNLKLGKVTSLDLGTSLRYERVGGEDGYFLGVKPEFRFSINENHRLLASVDLEPGIQSGSGTFRYLVRGGYRYRGPLSVAADVNFGQRDGGVFVWSLLAGLER